MLKCRPIGTEIGTPYHLVPKSCLFYLRPQNVLVDLTAKRPAELFDFLFQATQSSLARNSIVRFLGHYFSKTREILWAV